MKTILILLLAASPAWAFFGSSTSDGRTALLFAPDAAALDWPALQALLDRYSNAGLTLAIAAEDVPESEQEWLKEWAAKEFHEIALRLQGDPILPLIGRYRRRDAVDRIALGRVAYRKLFGRYPEGFVPGGGLLNPAFGPLLERQKFRWAAVGESDFLSSWYADKSMMLIPFHVPPSTHASHLHPRAAKAILLSELDGSLEAGAGVGALADLFDRTRPSRWISVGASLRSQRPYAVGPERWAGFTGGADLWTDLPIQRKAWRLYARAAASLAKYQNSGAARLSVLNKATAALYRAQSSRYYRSRGLSDPEADKAFREHLKRVHRLIRRRVPKELWRPMTAGLAHEAALPEAGDEEVEAEGAAQERGQVRSGDEDESIWFENPQGSMASAPRTALGLPPGTTAQNLFVLETLRVSWNPAAVVFVLGVKELRRDDTAPNGFTHLGLELYMDLNHLAGRGSTRLLPGRRGFVASGDAWEYVLVVNGWQASLFRAAPGQPAVWAGAVSSLIDEKTGEVRVTVPRTRLRGNPAAWGYVLLSTALDESGAKHKPPRPLAGEKGSPLLGLLGGLDDQQRLAQDASSYRRVSAVRLEREAAGIPLR